MPFWEKNNLHRSQSILNKSRKLFFPQKGMYKRYPLKHFGAFTVFIDRAMIEIQKHRLINCNTTRVDTGRMAHTWHQLNKENPVANRKTIAPCSTVEFKSIRQSRVTEGT